MRWTPDRLTTARRLADEMTYDKVALELNRQWGTELTGNAVSVALNSAKRGRRAGHGGRDSLDHDPPVPPRRPDAPHRDITGRLMGDPTIGRSALDRRAS